MKQVNTTPNPWFLLPIAAKFLLTHGKQFFYLAAVPLFFVFFQRLIFSFLPMSFLKQFFTVFLELLGMILKVVFSVEWIRFCIQRTHETQIFIPRFDRRYFMYAILSLGIFFIASLGESFMTFILKGFLMIFNVQTGVLLLRLTLIFLLSSFLFARLAPAFVAAALETSYQINKTWNASRNSWKPLFGYIMLLDTVMGLMSIGAYFAYLKLFPGAIHDPKFLISLLSENSWIIQIIGYAFLAVKLYGLCVYTKHMR
jgi:hypothetical protein